MNNLKIHRDMTSVPVIDTKKITVIGYKTQITGSVTQFCRMPWINEQSF